MIEGLQVQELIRRGSYCRIGITRCLLPQKLTYRLNSKGVTTSTKMTCLKAFDRPEFYEGANSRLIKHTPGPHNNLVFCCNIQHVIRTCEEFNAAGIPAKFLRLPYRNQSAQKTKRQQRWHDMSGIWSVITMGWRRTKIQRGAKAAVKRVDARRF